MRRTRAEVVALAPNFEPAILEVLGLEVPMDVLPGATRIVG